MQLFMLTFYIKVTKTEIEKLKSTYRHLAKEAAAAKEKYREALSKGNKLKLGKVLEIHFCFDPFMMFWKWKNIEIAQWSTIIF